MRNRNIQNGSVGSSVTTGSIRDSVPVGTVNPANQISTPRGFDHNYRAWWLTASNGSAACSIKVASSLSLVNPTLRISSLSSVNSVSLDGSSLAKNTDYYLSRDSINKECWITINRVLVGNNGIVINGATSTSKKHFEPGGRHSAVQGWSVRDKTFLSMTLRIASQGLITIADLFNLRGGCYSRLYRGLAPSGTTGLSCLLPEKNVHAGLFIAHVKIDGIEPVEEDLYPGTGSVSRPGTIVNLDDKGIRTGNGDGSLVGYHQFLSVS